MGIHMQHIQQIKTDCGIAVFGEFLFSESPPSGTTAVWLTMVSLGKVNHYGQTIVQLVARIDLSQMA